VSGRAETTAYSPRHLGRRGPDEVSAFGFWVEGLGRDTKR